MTAAITLIDQVVDAFIAAVSTTPGVTGVYEDRQQAYTHNEAPAIEVSLREATGDVLGDDHPARSVIKTTLLIELAIYTRSAIHADDLSGCQTGDRSAQATGEGRQESHALRGARRATQTGRVRDHLPVA